MTGEGKVDGRRGRFHQRSKSSIGDYTSPMILDPIKDVLIKGSPRAGKAASKEFSRSWFKSKKPTQPNPEASDLEAEDPKPLQQQQRIVQGLYRDDDGGPSPKILVTAHSAARDAVKEFAKDFLAQLKAGDAEAALAMESQMRQHLPLVSPPTDLKLVAQSYIAHHFFSDFENASFGIPNPGEKPWEVQDHMRRCFSQFQNCRKRSQTVSTLLVNEANESFLSQFCMKKLRAIIPLDLSAAFFGGETRDHPDLEKARHLDTPLYRSFLCAAVSVWLLQRLAFSFEQKIVTIFPTRGDAFQRRFMAPVVPGIGEDAEEEESDAALEVAFAVFPGFRVSESIVESSVFIVESPKSPPNIDSSIPLETASENPNESSTLPTPGLLKSVKTGEQGLLQKIRSKFIRKKTLVKGTVVAENGTPTPVPQPPSEEPESAPAPSIEGSATSVGELATSVGELAPSVGESPPSVGELATSVGESAPSVGELAPSAGELAPPRGETAAPLESEPSPPSDDIEETNAMSVTAPAAASVPSQELSAPIILQPPNMEEETDSYAPHYSSALEDEDRLYVPRADEPRLLQSPVRSPRLSSVD